MNARMEVRRVIVNEDRDWSEWPKFNQAVTWLGDRHLLAKPAKKPKRNLKK